MAQKKRNIPQFDVEKSLRRRQIERYFFRHRLFAVVAKRIGYFALCAMIWPRFAAPRRWRMTHYNVSMNNLGSEFNGYRIAQLTDLHTGATDQHYLQRVFETVMAEKPDLIVITGDLIEYRVGSLEKLEELLPILHAPDGVASIFGNHDYHEYSWRHVGPRSAHRAIHKRLRKVLAKHHVDLLCNSHRVIQRGDATLYIAGMDEIWTGNADVDTAFKGIPKDAACVCLQHNPDGIEFLRPYPWQLMLCGHTHGGQVRLPLAGSLFVPMKNRQYIRGWYDFPGDSAGITQRMFVSTGLGQSIPIRMRVPPEATIFTLCSEP